MAHIGLLHPGQMGLAVGSTLKNSGHEVLWASEGRSAQTAERASTAGFKDCVMVESLTRQADAIVSVCPPEFAREVAGLVARTGYPGLYAEVNAVSPDSKKEIANVIETAGATFVDGGIVGLPPKERGRTWLYLSGSKAEAVASLFTSGPMEVEVLGDQVGRATALKMCYAAWSKGSTALIAAVMAAAEDMLVLEELKCAWSRGGPVYSKIEADILRAAPKAWRWTAEMREIAATLESAGLPGGFHHAAEDLYARLRTFKDSADIQMNDVMARLTSRD